MVGSYSVMRRFMRHPSDIPIELKVEQCDRRAAAQRRLLNDVGAGGLSFHSAMQIPVGSIVTIRIPTVSTAFEFRGHVTWCIEATDCFNVGLAFDDRDEAFKARMMEQVCHIERYKRSVQREEGRSLTGEEAAREWIEKYASEFPGAR